MFVCRESESFCIVKDKMLMYCLCSPNVFDHIRFADLLDPFSLDYGARSRHGVRKIRSGFQR